MIHSTKALSEIERLIEGQQYARAEEELTGLLTYRPNDPDVWDMLAYCYGRNADSVKAVPASSKAIELRPGEISYYVFRARHLLLVGDPEASYKDSSHIVEWSTQNDEQYYLSHARLLMAEALFRLGKYGEAIKVCEAISPDSAWWCGHEPRTREHVLADCKRNAKS